jgi:hypothetical protein
VFSLHVSIRRIIMLSRLFLAQLFFRPWRWRRCVPPKRRLTLNRLHGVISQEMLLFRNFLVEQTDIMDPLDKARHVFWKSNHRINVICLCGLNPDQGAVSVNFLLFFHEDEETLNLNRGPNSRQGPPECKPRYLATELLFPTVPTWWHWDPGGPAHGAWYRWWQGECPSCSEGSCHPCEWRATAHREQYWAHPLGGFHCRHHIRTPWWVTSTAATSFLSHYIDVSGLCTRQLSLKAMS